MSDPVDLGAKPFKKGCYDLEGDGPYPDGYTINTVCTDYTCESNGKKGKKEKFSWTSQDNGFCCMVGEYYYASGCVVSSEQKGACTTMSNVCAYDEFAMQMAIVPQLSVTGCSVDGECLPYGETLYWTEKCAELQCSDDWGATLHYNSWFEGCNCCLYESPSGYSQLIEDGGYTYGENGYMLECCNGELKYVFPYSVNGTYPWEGGPGGMTYGSASSSPDSSSSTTEITSSTDGSTSSTTNWGP